MLPLTKPLTNTEAQVAAVVRICDGTLKKRLNEFDETSASEMTVPQVLSLVVLLALLVQKY
jgi:hypothetical protein